MLKKDKILHCRLSVTTGSFLYFNVISVYNTIKKGSFLAPFLPLNCISQRSYFKKCKEGTIYIKHRDRYLHIFFLFPYLFNMHVKNYLFGPKKKGKPDWHTERREMWFNDQNIKKSSVISQQKEVTHRMQVLICEDDTGRNFFCRFVERRSFVLIVVYVSRDFIMQFIILIVTVVVQNVVIYIIKGKIFNSAVLRVICIS